MIKWISSLSYVSYILWNLVLWLIQPGIPDPSQWWKQEQNTSSPPPESRLTRNKGHVLYNQNAPTTGADLGHPCFILKWGSLASSLLHSPNGYLKCIIRKIKLDALNVSKNILLLSAFIFGMCTSLVLKNPSWPWRVKNGTVFEYIEEQSKSGMKW